MLKKILNKALRLKIAEHLYYRRKRKNFLSPGFLLSNKYEKLIYKKVPDPFVFEDFLDDAEKCTMFESTSLSGTAFRSVIHKAVVFCFVLLLTIWFYCLIPYLLNC